MCDRPAKGGDKLVSTSFHDTPTRGFAAADDRSVAVCLLPGTELSFDKEIRCEGVIFSWSPGHKVAKFQQVRPNGTLIMTLWNFRMGRLSC